LGGKSSVALPIHVERESTTAAGGEAADIALAGMILSELVDAAGHLAEIAARRAASEAEH